LAVHRACGWCDSSALGSTEVQLLAVIAGWRTSLRMSECALWQGPALTTMRRQGGRATSGARGSDDEVAGCATSVAGGSDDKATEGGAASGAGGGGWDVASEGCSPSVWPFPRSARFACLYPSRLLFPRAEDHAGGCQCLNA